MKVLSRSVSVTALQFSDLEVAKSLFTIHEKYVVVPADKAPNNNVFVYQTYYTQCLFSEVDVENNSSSKTYTATILSKEEILENHKSVLSSFGLSTKDDDCDLPSIYWIPKLHKNPYKQRFIAGSSKYTTKPLSKLSPAILTAVKDGI